MLFNAHNIVLDGGSVQHSANATAYASLWRLFVAGSLLFMNKLSHLQGSILNNLIYFDDIEFHLLELIHLCQHL